MSSFLYYLPSTAPAAPSLEAIQQVGLSHAFDALPTMAKMSQGGPDGGAGYVLGDKDRMGDWEIKYRPKEQEWHEMPCGAWVGWYTKAVPGPDSLSRDMLLAGYPTDMNDGQEWRIPLIRDVSDVGEAECALPAVMTMDKTGQVGKGGPVARYRELWEATAWAWDAMVNEEDIDLQRAMDTAGLVFGANYYVSAFEMCQLGVFSEDKTPAAVLAIASGAREFGVWKQAQEASEVEGKSSSPAATSGEPTSDGEAA